MLSGSNPFYPDIYILLKVDEIQSNSVVITKLINVFLFFMVLHHLFACASIGCLATTLYMYYVHKPQFHLKDLRVLFFFMAFNSEVTLHSWQLKASG